MKKKNYRIIWAGSFMSTLAACREVEHRTLASALASLGRVAWCGDTVCRTRCTDDRWTVYRNTHERDGDTDGRFALAVIAREV